MKLQQFVKQNMSISYNRIKQDIELSQHIQQILFWHKILESKPDGKFGRISTYALCHFQKIHGINETYLGAKTASTLVNFHPTKTKDVMRSISPNFLDRLVTYLKLENYKIFTEADRINIVYVEGVDPNFGINADTPNVFNDLCVVFDFVRGKPRLIGKWVATADPGRYYTDNPMNRLGALHHNGQATAWKVDWHKTHEALIQVKRITVTRDYNRDFRTAGDKEDNGYFGANCHGADTNNLRDIGRWSAGCKVIWKLSKQAEFMACVKSDLAFSQNENFLFTVATVDGTCLININSSREEVLTINFSQEIQILAKTIWGEARGESRTGKIAVGHTIYNRYQISKATAYPDWWGNTISQICLQPWQYSCWNKNDPNRAKLEQLTQSDPHYRECLEIARGIISGEIADNTKGATHYFNPRYANPSWADEMTKVVSIGDHDFYK